MPRVGRSRADQAELLLSETTEALGCLISARTPGRSYAYAWAEGRLQGAHRIVWEAANGPIPDGHHLHHRCERKRCLNVEHMETLTAEDHGNLHGDTQRQKNCSIHGTPYDRRRHGGKIPVCYACRREQSKLYRDRKRARLSAVK